MLFQRECENWIEMTHVVLCELSDVNSLQSPELDSSTLDSSAKHKVMCFPLFSGIPFSLTALTVKGKGKKIYVPPLL